MQRFDQRRSAAAWSPSISAPIPALVRCTLSMKGSLRWRERDAASSPTSRIRMKSPSWTATIGLGLGCCDERHVVAQPGRKRGGISGGRPSCRHVAREDLQGCLVRENAHQQGVVLQPARDRPASATAANPAAWSPARRRG